MLWLPLIALAGGGPAWAPDRHTQTVPSIQTEIYYNARMALRDHLVRVHREPVATLGVLFLIARTHR